MYQALWEHYQPMGHVEVLLLDKIAADTIRLNRLLAGESKYLLKVVEDYARYISAVSRQLLEDIRELERVQQQRKAGTVERHATKRRAEDSAVTETDWTAVVPPCGALASEYRQKLETRAARAASLETKPTSSELGKPNGVTAPKPVVPKQFGLDVPERSVNNVGTNSTSPASSATTPHAAWNGKLDVLKCEARVFSSAWLRPASGADHPV
jgi:hypothetical protein